MDTLRGYGNFIRGCNWSKHEAVAHKGYVRRIVAHYLEQAARISEAMGDDDLDHIENTMDKGFLDVSARGPAWKMDFADWVYRRMKNTSTHMDDGQPQHLSGVNDHYLQKVIREVIS
jgi:hypothetical protein